MSRLPMGRHLSRCLPLPMGRHLSHRFPHLTPTQLRLCTITSLHLRPLMTQKVLTCMSHYECGDTRGLTSTLRRHLKGKELLCNLGTSHRCSLGSTPKLVQMP